MQPRSLQPSPAHAQAIDATRQLLSALRVDAAFVGSVARAAWTGAAIETGSVDVLALTSPDRSRQIPMMASNRGFHVDPEEVERAEELDLIPMRFGDADQGVRIHVLMATNTLYARMIRNAVEVPFEDQMVTVISAEDFGLLLAVDEGDDARHALLELIHGAGSAFDLHAFNRRLVSIGLGTRVVR